MKTAIKERPILFNGPMVRALLDGSKTQTRRIVDRVGGFGKVRQFQASKTPGCDFTFRCKHSLRQGFRALWQDFRKSELLERSPFGVVGDRLWVRETWMPFDDDHRVGDCKFAYRASTSSDGEDIRKDYIRNGRAYQWRPSIHMPRLASRITLEITGVRVERLNDISESDAMAEGIEREKHKFGGVHYKLYGDLEKHNQWTVGPKWSFETLWESINGPGSWTLNPWVWVIEFKKLDGDA